MASALTALSNASLVLTVPAAGTSTTTDDLGNVKPVTTTITVAAYLKKQDPTTIDLAGIDADADLFEGYALTALDSRITRGTTGTIAFAGQPARSCVVQDRDFPYGATGLLGSTLTAALGAKIRVIRYQQR